MKRHMVHIGLLLPMAQACVQPYDIDEAAYEKVLVVDGTITDQEGPYTISLAYTYATDTVQDEYSTDATVWVEDGEGELTYFSWTEEGDYVSPDGFIGEENQSYTLHIRLADSTQYVSSTETLLTAPPIDTLYGTYASLPDDSGEQYTNGIQFFINTHDDSGTAKYFRYEWEEAYKIITPYPSNLVYSNGQIVSSETIRSFCYSEDSSAELIYGSSVGSTGSQLIAFPVHFVSEETQALRIRYMLYVKQYAISESAYLYYKKLDEMNEAGGSLFDQQTGSIYGNIYNENDEGDQVLGFFEASGESTLRKFFDNSDLDDRLSVQFPYTCNLNTNVYTVLDSIGYYMSLGYDVYDYEYSDGTVYINMQPIGCIDCSFYADTTPPDYWIDHD